MSIVKQEIEELIEIINKADKAYYIDSTPVMTDLEYDEAYNRLKKLEEENPQFKRKNSPTVRVGSDIDNNLPEKTHKIPVLSLDKCYTITEITEWIDKNKVKLAKDIEVVIEPKIDGASVVLYYEDGEFVTGLTRGNGLSGNDITENLKTIKSIPLTINYKKPLAIRGEVYINKGEFKTFNEKFADNLYSNPRNLASGSIRRLKSSESALFPLNVFLYDGYFFSENFTDHLSNLTFLKELGFPLNSHVGIFSNNFDKLKAIPFKDAKGGKLSDISDFVDYFKEIRKELAYEIDGLVIKINDLASREELGFTQHHPRWAIAFKFDAPLAQTKVLSIDIQVGRGGRITPVANLEPVELSGSVISRATLHNQDYIDQIEVNAGDSVTISKRGDVIPAVEEVTEKGQFAVPYKIPLNCPSCNSVLVKDGSHIFCRNDDCPKRLLGTLQYFVSKDQMNIETLGDKTLEFLFEKSFVKYIPDIYTFNYDLLLDFEGFKEKKISNIKQSVELSKKKDFKTILASLGLEDIGNKVSELLVNNLNSIDNILTTAATGEEAKFTSIDGIGELTAKSIIKHFTNPKVIETINKLKQSGLIFIGEQKDGLPQEQLFLSGTKWVITGSFDSFKPRDKAGELIKTYGGELVDTVSSKTTHLLCGSEAGSKLEKAAKLGVKIINEESFLKIIEEKII